MKRIKRILTVALALIIAFSLAACGCGKEEDKLEAQLTLGEKYLKAKDYDKAQEAYKKALDMDQYSIKAYEGLVVAMLEDEPVTDKVPEDVAEVISSANEAILSIAETEKGLTQAQKREANGFYEKMSEVTENDPDVFVETMFTGTIVLGTESNIGEIFKEKAPEAYEKTAASDIVVGENSQDIFALIEQVKNLHGEDADSPEETEYPDDDAQENDNQENDNQENDNQEDGNQEEEIIDIPIFIGAEDERKDILSDNVTLQVPISNKWSALSDANREALENIFLEYVPLFAGTGSKSTSQSILDFGNKLADFLRQDEVYQEVVSDGSFEVNYIISGDLERVYELLNISGVIEQDGYMISMEYSVEGESLDYFKLQTYDISKNYDSVRNRVSFSEYVDNYSANSCTLNSSRYNIDDGKYSEDEPYVDIASEKPGESMCTALFVDAGGTKKLFLPAGEDVYTTPIEVNNAWVNLSDSSKQKIANVCEEATLAFSAENQTTVLETEVFEFVVDFVKLCLSEGIIDAGDTLGNTYDFVHVASGKLGGEAEYVLVNIRYFAKVYTLDIDYYKVADGDNILASSDYWISYSDEHQMFLERKNTYQKYDYLNGVKTVNKLVYDNENGIYTEETSEHGVAGGYLLGNSVMETKIYTGLLVIDELYGVIMENNTKEQN